MNKPAGKSRLPAESNGAGGQRRLSKLFEVILDAIPLGVLLVQKRVVQWNSLAHDTIFGYERGECVGLESRAFYAHQEDNDRVGKEAYAQIAKGGVYTTELEMRRKDGSVFWGRIVGQAVEPGNLEEGTIWILSDITESRRMIETIEKAHFKRTEEAFRMRERRFAQLIENSFDAIVILDANGIQRYVSPSAVRSHGFQSAELVNIPVIKEMIHPEDQERVQAAFEEIIQHGQGGAQYRHRHKNGGWVYLEAWGTNQLDNPEIQGVVVNVRDLTERKRGEEEKARLEAQNRQLQKAESLGRMAGAIAHHFNNQLQTVIMDLDFAMRSRGDVAVETLSEAMQAARKAADVSSMMLTYLGQTQGKPKPLNLTASCLRNLPLLRAAMPATTVLETDLPTPGPVICADLNQIQQLLANLVTNAWEAVKDGKGVVQLRVKTVSASQIPMRQRFPIDWHPVAPDYACLEVADRGCGIAPADIEKIFDPFFTSKFAGRGLGLSVVLGIVQAHQGVVTVESSMDQGSIFRVFLPVTTEPAPQPTKTPCNSVAFDGGGTILLAEDEEGVRKSTTAVLKQFGFKVLAAADGREAVELFRQNQGEISLVLSDLAMPGMNGWETMAAIRKLAPDLPVILSSGFNEAQAMAGQHAEQPQAFLGKPYRIDDLQDTIARALRKAKKNT
jgi:PAS domain S-box-containing protein